MVSVNPYANSRNENEFSDADYAVSQNAYAAPSLGAPYGLPGAPYADSLTYERGSTPDPTRVQREPITDARQNPTKPKRWWRLRAVDQDDRESVQQQSGIIGQERGSASPVVPRPLGVDTVTRPLADTSPNTYSFSRPFTGMTPKRFNGLHFSMADHKRYPNEIYGMAPAKTNRGTYRADVAGWSEGDVDRVMASDEQYTYTVPTMPSTQRSYRLDS